MRESRISTAVVHANYTTRLSYYDDWLDAFRRADAFDTTAVDLCASDAGASLKTRLRDTDLVVLLHSTNGDTTRYLERVVPLLADRRCRLLSFVGNELNLPGSPISTKRKIFSAIEPDFIATQLPLGAGEYLWGESARQAVLAVPHALNPEAFRPEIRDDLREVDIGVRAARYLAYLGDDDRNRVHDLFARPDHASDLKVDISTQRLSRNGWARFLNNCRGTVSSEAGSWFLERDDSTMEAIRLWANEHVEQTGLLIPNDSTLRELGHRLPWWMRVAVRKLLSRGPVRHESTVQEKLDFDEVFDQFFKGRSRPNFYGKCISSRHFDAIGTRTCQILLAGRYNDVLTADQHYISLSADFSNLDAVLTRFRDRSERERISSAALAHVLEGHTHAHRVAGLERAITESYSAK